jgi:RNA recognition motif-containing protein
MSTDPFTGRNPSYCFVELGTPEEANRAMGELNGKEIMGRPVKININTPKRGKDRSEGARPPIQSYDRGWRPQTSAPQDPKEGKGNPYVFDRWQRKDAAEHFKGPSEENRRLYVGGLPRIPNQDTVNEEMRALFKDYEM